jgi:hypothetical protein
MLTLAGIVNCLYGVAGLAGDEHLVEDSLLFGAVEFWGGVNLIVGAIQLMIVLLLVKDVPSGTWLGIGLAAVNAIAQLMAVGAYPLWSLTVLVIDVLIIYALAVHGPREAAP